MFNPCDKEQRIILGRLSYNLPLHGMSQLRESEAK